MKDENDDSISAEIDDSKWKAVVLEQMIQLNAKLAVMLAIQATVLAHLTKTDEKELAEFYAEKVDVLVVEWTEKLANR